MMTDDQTDDDQNPGSKRFLKYNIEPCLIRLLKHLKRLQQTKYFKEPKYFF